MFSSEMEELKSDLKTNWDLVIIVMLSLRQFGFSTCELS